MTYLKRMATYQQQLQNHGVPSELAREIAEILADESPSSDRVMVDQFFRMWIEEIGRAAAVVHDA